MPPADDKINLISLYMNELAESGWQIKAEITEPDADDEGASPHLFLGFYEQGVCRHYLAFPVTLPE